VTNSAGLDSGWQQGADFTIENKAYPYVDFTWLPLNPAINEVVSFDSSSSTVYGDSPYYTWHFGEGADPAMSHSDYPTATYTTGGDKTITLNIHDSIGSCTTTKSITATLPIPGWEEIPPE
jgi:PKD repeat protein